MKRTRIRRVSQKMREQRMTEREVKLALLARDGGCRGRYFVPEVTCSGPLDKDEIKTRGRGGSAVDLNNTQLLCRYGHHEWKGRHPEEAVDRGLALWSWDPDPTEPPPLTPSSVLPKIDFDWESRPVDFPPGLEPF